VGWPVPVPLALPGEEGPYTSAWSRYETPGWFCFGGLPVDAATGETLRFGETTIRAVGQDFAGLVATICADDSFDVEGVRDLPGFAMMPFSSAHVNASLEDAKELGRDGAAESLAAQVLSWSGLVARLALKALAALSITEAVEVEIVEAPMEKRDRKRAAKRGWPVAGQVVIRSSRRYRDPRPPSGEEARYSHRFWRRAHVAHYPLGTMLADARPDLVTACNRPPESNCGFCRKVKRPACIVGPEDKPIVLKTLVRRLPRADA
jgi:hypothetical protein